METNSSPNKPTLKLDWCSYEAAKYAVEHWHYSKIMPGGKRACIGVWEDDHFTGTLVFGSGVSPDIGRPFGIEQTAVCELERLALRPHHMPVSRILAIAVKIIRRTYPGLKLLVSFADTKMGHHGGIYQAAGWLYVGDYSHRRIIVDGVAKKDATLRSQFGGGQWRTKIKATHSVKYIQEPPKHKYLYPLNDEMREKILPLARPYPKRAVSETIDTSGHQPEKGGEEPTTALHTP